MGALKKIGELALREQVFKYSGHVFAGKGSGISVHKIYVGDIVIAVRVVGVYSGRLELSYSVPSGAR